MNSQDTGAEAPAATSTGATVGQMRAVTISREYGSGGGEIAARLAQKLGWQLIDHEIVVRVADVPTHLVCRCARATGD